MKDVSHSDITNLDIHPQLKSKTGSPHAKGMGKEEKNPLRAVRAPGHTGVSGGHVKLTVRTVCFEGTPGGAGNAPDW
ncbi:hypothetical protein EVAR_86360_1 [Eumeta japonica]|uniref:Uncharacterized protein n=1 Tax=Eumeta variegata TaxID=151549 RepID=A0A4C1YFM2_EUMVA|nr:hypothetical protein EVAR_86360_1 [Eumeta japonica]